MPLSTHTSLDHTIQPIQVKKSMTKQNSINVKKLIKTSINKIKEFKLLMNEAVVSNKWCTLSCYGLFVSSKDDVKDLIIIIIIIYIIII